VAGSLRSIFRHDVRHWIHVSPAIGVNTLVRNPAGEVLLLKRQDNGLWSLPRGVGEIGETPAEAALRELWEEAGLRGEVIRLLGVFDGQPFAARLYAELLKVAGVDVVVTVYNGPRRPLATTWRSACRRLGALVLHHIFSFGGRSVQIALS
jgi:ADP-ribose pyrophosphatase YjhB (NUDIX family)